MSIEAESDQSGSRLFIVIAIALIGLICIGLMGLSGVLYLTASDTAQEQAALQITDTPTPFPPTFTPSPTATHTPTYTPEPTSTSTLVVPLEGEPTEPGEATPPDSGATPTSISAVSSQSSTETPVVIVANTATPGAIPSSGGVLPASTGITLFWIGGGMLLVLMVYGVIYRSKT